MNNAQIADVFEEMAELLEFQGSNPFRIRAYRNAARTIQDLNESLSEIAKDESRKLTDLDGIGQELAEKISKLLETGSLPQHQKLLEEVPKGITALLKVPKLGPKKVAALYEQLKITNLEELRAACQQKQIRELKGFGAKTEEEILKNIDLAEEASQRILWASAEVHVHDVLAHLKTCQSIVHLEVAGSYRRRKETVGDLDFLVTSTDPNEVMDRLGTFPNLTEVIARGDTKMSIRLKGGLQMDLRVVPEESFGAALQYFTGSQQHNIVTRRRAKERGYKINEYGVFAGEKLIAGATEEEVYAAIDLPWIPPELREARQEFDWAETDTLPELVDLPDLRGDLHMHTTATDGQATLTEMIEAARELGREYIAITDHSKRVTVANGLTAERLLQQWEEIDKLRGKYSDIQVFKGIEVDILEKGGLDLPDEVLAQADWVVASLHFGQQQSESQITDRILEAIRNPYVSAIGHPTGRLINQRKPYAVDLDAIMQAAAEHKTFLELNASPMRLDLNDVACATAKRHGVSIVINSDAHSIHGLHDLKYGILQARRAGLTKADVANALPWSELQSRLGRG